LAFIQGLLQMCSVSCTLRFGCLPTAFLTHVHSRDNDLVPLLNGPQAPIGKTQSSRLLEGQIQHFPEFPFFRLNLPPATQSNHLSSMLVQENWSVPRGVGSTIPLTHLRRKQQPHRESCPPLTEIAQTRGCLITSSQQLMNSVIQAICAKADNSNSSLRPICELWIYILQ